MCDDYDGDDDLSVKGRADEEMDTRDIDLDNLCLEDAPPAYPATWAASQPGLSSDPASAPGGTLNGPDAFGTYEERERKGEVASARLLSTRQPPDLRDLFSRVSDLAGPPSERPTYPTQLDPGTSVFLPDVPTLGQTDVAFGLQTSTEHSLDQFPMLALYGMSDGQAEADGNGQEWRTERSRANALHLVIIQELPDYLQVAPTLSAASELWPERDSPERVQWRTALYEFFSERGTKTRLLQ